MNWIAYIHLETKLCNFPAISVNGYRFPDKDQADQWIKDQVQRFGDRVLRQKVVPA